MVWSDKGVLFRGHGAENQALQFWNDGVKLSSVTDIAAKDGSSARAPNVRAQALSRTAGRPWTAPADIDGEHSPTSLRTVLSSIREFLAPFVHCETLALLLRDSTDNILRLYAVEPRHLRQYASVSFEFADDELIETVLNQQQLVIAPDVDTCERFPRLINRMKTLGVRSLCIVPLSTPSGRSGALCFGSMVPREYSESEVQMLQSVGAGLCPLIECAKLQDEARDRESRVLRERDALAILLDINNFIISHRTMKELIVAISSTLRRWFHHDFAGLWVLTEQNKLSCVGLDYPDGRGLIESFAPELDEERVGKLNMLRPSVKSRQEIETLPQDFAGPLIREGITNLLSIPLRTPHRVVGFLAVGSIQADCFREEDLPLFTQIGSQVALATENALVFHELSQAHDQLKSEKLYLESELNAEYNFLDIVGKSAAIKTVLEQVAVVAKSDATVLLLGETGTGKELIARAIHNLSERKPHTFVRLNCAAIPSGLVESELFGHEKGAFTGALSQKIGRFELAHRGTLLLDEVGDIPLELQVKLLRALQEREFERLGSTRTIKVDVRVVAATHRDLSELIRSGQFREDLFYRLNVFPIRIPPLRERPEDIPLLVQHFVALFSRRMRKNIRSIPSDTLAKMTHMHWPGNIRELENVIERAVILTQGETLQVLLPEEERPVAAPPVVSSPMAPTLEDVERNALLEALRRAKGRISGPEGAAALLGLKRTTFHSKMRRLNLQRSDLWRE